MNTLDILKATSKDGEYLSFSMANIVCRVTPLCLLILLLYSGMKYLDSLNQLDHSENIYIYGSGSYAKTLSDQISFHRKDIIIVNYLDKYKKGEFLDSIEIINLENLSKIDKSLKIIVSTDISFWEEIVEDLNGFNVYLNRFNDFNIYRREEGIYDKEYIKSLYLKSKKVDIFFNAIENQTIKDLINNQDIPDSNESFLEKLNLLDSHKIINGGGANGNENENFLKKIGKKGVIYSFDPNHEAVSETPQLEIHPYVLYGSTGRVMFEYNGSRSRIIEDDNDSSDSVESITIDEFIKKKGIKKIDCITLDVEGLEKAVLEGAENCIKEFKPTLAISIYHSTADFYEIPFLLNKLCNEYKFDIGIYSPQGVDTILHAQV